MKLRHFAVFGGIFTVIICLLPVDFLTGIEKRIVRFSSSYYA